MCRRTLQILKGLVRLNSKWNACRMNFAALVEFSQCSSRVVSKGEKKLEGQHDSWTDNYEPCDDC